MSKFQRRRVAWLTAFAVFAMFGVGGYYLLKLPEFEDPNATQPLYRPQKVAAMVQTPLEAPALKRISELTDHDLINENSLVLGLTINGESRAYPLNQLVGPTREVINDELGGRSIMATW